MKLVPSARLATFNYEILDLLEAGEPNLPEICRALQPTGSFAVIWPAKGEIATESIAEPYYRLLEKLDGKTMPPRIAADLAIPPDEAREFLEFAAAEGIVVLGDY